MEDKSEGEIYSDISGSCSETTSDAKDSRFAFSPGLDFLDTSVLSGAVTVVKKDQQPQAVSKTENLSAVDALEDDADIYSDLGESCSQSKRRIEEAHSAASAKLDLLDTSVLPQQPTPLKKDGPPKSKTSGASGRLIPSGSRTSSAAVSSAVQATIVALKKENGMLRHNISVLYKTAKQLLDSRDKEIKNLQRRLDNLVFKRNLGSQNSPHAATAATSARSPQQQPQRKGNSSWNSPGTPTAQSPQGPSVQRQGHCSGPTVPTRPKVDMSEDLQRLYEYNNVRPRHRTEYSQVPKLVVASRKKEDATKVPGTPTKSAAQRNAKRLLKNSIKISSSPTKVPRGMEVNRKLGLLQLKMRRVSGGAPLAARFNNALHHEKRGPKGQVSPKDWPVEPNSMQSKTPPSRHKSAAEGPRTWRESWSPEPERHLDRCTTPPREKRIAKGPHTPPGDQPVELSAKHFRTPPLARRVASGPHTPPEGPPKLVTKRHGSPHLVGQKAAKGPHTPPTENMVTKGPPEYHLVDMRASQSKQRAGPSEQARKVAEGVGKAASGLFKYQDMTAKAGRPSEEGRLREHLGIKHGRSPSGYARSTRPPPSSLSEVVQVRRAHSPRESEDFRSLPAKRRRSRSRSYSRSPSPRPYSPRRQPQRISVHDRLGFHRGEHRILGHRRHSPESRAMRRRSRERFSPPPRRRHLPERPAYSPSPPRIGRTTRRQHSAGRTPKSPASEGMHARMSDLCKQPANESEKRTLSVMVNASVTSKQAEERTCVVTVYQGQEAPCQSSEAVAGCVPETEALTSISAGDTEKTKEPSEKMDVGVPGDV